MQIHLLRKKVILFLFIHLLCVSIYSNDIHAKDIGYKTTYEISNKIVEENIIKDREKIMEQLNQKRTPEYSEYKYELIETLYKTASGWAGNVPEGGIRFKTGGAFHWDPSGERTVNVSLGMSYNGVSIGISLGQHKTSNTTYICNVPSTNDFYRLWATTKYKIKVQKVYGKRIGSSTYTYLYTIYPKSFYSVELEARKV